MRERRVREGREREGGNGGEWEAGRGREKGRGGEGESERARGYLLKYPIDEIC